MQQEFLDAEFWAKNSSRFLAFALRCLSHGRRPAGAEAMDFVTQAAMLILDGTRRCPERVPPVIFVLGVIRSLVSHAGETAENRTIHESIDDRNATVDAVHEEVEANDLARKFLEAVPPRYRDYVVLLMSGQHATAEERARAMGVSVDRIRQLDKAVRRLRSQWEGSEPPGRQGRQ